MKICNVDLDRDVLLIAEIGNNHEGDFGRAKEMVAAAAAAGAHVVKFQTIIPEHLVTADQTARLEQLGRFRLSADQHADLAAQAAGLGVAFMSTPFSTEAVDLLDPLVPAFKIASCDNDNLPLLRRVAATGKPVLISTGLSDQGQARAIVDTMHDAWRACGVAAPGLVLLHCVSSYPTPPSEAALGAIRALAGLGVPVGYSDHTLGIDAAVLSVALGACVIEKHFTLDKTREGFRDHQLSADPADLAALARRVREAKEMIGEDIKTLMPSEKQALLAIRRGLYARQTLAVGDVFRETDADCLRPRVDLGPLDLSRLAGRRLARAVVAGAPLSEADFV